MADLIAQGTHAEHRWRRTLPVGKPCVIGREAGGWATPWDNRVSRRHVEVLWDNGRLEVQKVPHARNPIFFRGRQEERFAVRAGEHFVIGDTTFTVVDERVRVAVDSPFPVAEEAFSPVFLQHVRFRDADQRIEGLSRLQEIVSGVVSDSELFGRLINVLLFGIPAATSAAVVEARRDGPVKILHWDRRMLTGQEFTPSERLIRKAAESEESVVHVWSGSANPAGAAFTVMENTDWAFCTPVPGPACHGLAIYVAGTSQSGESVPITDPHQLRDDLKFTELAANMLRNVREMRLLQQNQAKLRQFLSPVVIEAMAGHDPNTVLAPREADVSVLFCDLRGFSLSSERSAHDLLGLLQRVSQALGIMTRHILDEGGVIGDFHGDAAMGFWGWPLAQDDTVERACRAALAIRAEFARVAREPGHPLANFRVGIGLATGRAVAGEIGTVDQVKVTAFGPVVNLASRLEGMTKLLRAPILLDEASSQVARGKLPREVARLRRVARVLPFGLETPLEVSELLPPEAESPEITDEHIAAYEQALDALQAREWSRAFTLLHRVPAEDLVKDFLTVFIVQHNRTPPANWDGVIPLSVK